MNFNLHQERCLYVRLRLWWWWSLRNTLLGCFSRLWLHSALTRCYACSCAYNKLWQYHLICSCNVWCHLQVITTLHQLSKTNIPHNVLRYVAAICVYMSEIPCNTYVSLYRCKYKCPWNMHEVHNFLLYLTRGVSPQGCEVCWTNT